MDVGPSRVVVCSSDYAWYYRVHPGNRDPQQHRRLRHERPLGGTALGTSDGEDGRGGECGEASNPPVQLRGFPLPSSSVAEARLSGDEERCFFGTTSGHIYVVRRDLRVDGRKATRFQRVFTVRLPRRRGAQPGKLLC